MCSDYTCRTGFEHDHARVFNTYETVRRQAHFGRSSDYTPAWVPLVRAPDAAGRRFRNARTGPARRSAHPCSARRRRTGETRPRLAAAVDLDRSDVERRLADRAVEQLRGAGGGGVRIGAHAAKLRGRADGLGLLDREAGVDGDAQMVDLHHLAGLSTAGAAAQARRPVAKARCGSRRNDKISGADIRFAWRILLPFGCWIMVK